MWRLGVVIVLAACSSTDAGPHVLLDFSRPQLFDAPVPSDDLRAGTTANIAIADPQVLPIVDQVTALLAGNNGFATTGGVFFQISDPLDVTGLPAIADSVAADSPAFVIGIDPNAPDYGVRYPLEVSFEPIGDQYGAPNLVTLLPVQGTPLRPGTRYAAVLTTALHAMTGEALAVAPADVIARFTDAAVGVEPSQIAGITAFTTGDTATQLATVRTVALARPLPMIDAPFVLTDVFLAISAPITRRSRCPTGSPVIHRSPRRVARGSSTTPARRSFSGPRKRTSWSRSRAASHRRRDTRSSCSCAPAAAAIGRSSIAASNPRRMHHRSSRARTKRVTSRARASRVSRSTVRSAACATSPTATAEQFLTFNISNLGALRSNVRESAVELDVIAHVGVALTIDVSDCPGATPSATFDATHVAIMGHSMGAWIAPLAAAVRRCSAR